MAALSEHAFLEPSSSTNGITTFNTPLVLGEIPELHARDFTVQGILICTDCGECDVIQSLGFLTRGLQPQQG